MSTSPEFTLRPSKIWPDPFRVLHCACGWKDPCAYHLEGDFEERKRHHSKAPQHTKTGES